MRTQAKEDLRYDTQGNENKAKESKTNFDKTCSFDQESFVFECSKNESKSSEVHQLA